MKNYYKSSNLSRYFSCPISPFKNVLNDKICHFMKQRNGSQITIGDTQIKMVEKKDYSPLTFTYVEECLKTIITGDDNLKYIMKTLKDNREIKLSNELKKV